MSSEVLYLRVPESLKRALAVQAGLYQVDVNRLCNWILEEAMQPHDELVLALQERAEEVESRKHYTTKVVIQDNSSIPAPRAVTQPFPERGRESRDEYAIWEASRKVR